MNTAAFLFSLHVTYRGSHVHNLNVAMT